MNTSIVENLKHTIDSVEGFVGNFKKVYKDLKNAVAVQGDAANWSNTHYMRGMYNGLELALSVFESREPKYKSNEEFIEANLKKKSKADVHVYMSDKAIGSYVTVNGELISACQILSLGFEATSEKGRTLDLRIKDVTLHNLDGNVASGLYSPDPNVRGSSDDFSGGAGFKPSKGYIEWADEKEAEAFKTTAPGSKQDPMLKAADSFDIMRPDVVNGAGDSPSSDVELSSKHPILTDEYMNVSFCINAGIRIPMHDDSDVYKLNFNQLEQLKKLVHSNKGLSVESERLYYNQLDGVINHLKCKQKTNTAQEPVAVLEGDNGSFVIKRGHKGDTPDLKKMNDLKLNNYLHTIISSGELSGKEKRDLSMDALAEKQERLNQSTKGA